MTAVTKMRNFKLTIGALFFCQNVLRFIHSSAAWLESYSFFCANFCSADLPIYHFIQIWFIYFLNHIKIFLETTNPN
jgi:hypothetical protein